MGLEAEEELEEEEETVVALVEDAFSSFRLMPPDPVLQSPLLSAAQPCPFSPFSLSSLSLSAATDAMRACAATDILGLLDGEEEGLSSLLLLLRLKRRLPVLTAGSSSRTVKAPSFFGAADEDAAFT